MAVFILIATLMVLSVLGVPLIFAILAAGVVSVAIVRPNLPLDIVAQTFMDGIDGVLLLAVVFFFLAGELMNLGGITRRIVTFASTLVGHIRGGLGHVNVLSSVLFSGISGSAIADTAAVGTVMIPSMKERGYPPAFAAAITQTSAIIGPIIPPSVPMILYAVLAEESVGKMFVAGVLPGIVVGACLMLTVYLISRRRGFPREERAGRALVWSSFREAVPALMMPLIIVGGILGGVMTATDAGAVAVLYGLIAGFLVYRELTWAKTWKAIVRSAQGASTVLVILGASTFFAWIVADQQINRDVAEMVFSISREPVTVLLLIVAFGLVIGTLMDPLAALIIMVPVFLPTVVEIGIDPAQFGLVLVLTLMIGLCTPPVGYLIYLSAGIAQAKPEAVVRESLPFLGALIAALLICVVFPSVSLSLPAWFGYS